MIMMRLAIVVGMTLAATATYASHTFDVRIHNKTGEQVEVKSVMVKAKGPAMEYFCSHHGGFPTVVNNEYTQCSATGTVKKWRRRIKVQFYCKTKKITATVTFPRDGGWFPRKHLVDKDRYNVTLKATDC